MDKSKTRDMREIVMKNTAPSVLMSAIIAGILAPIVMTGCTVGPNYHRPAVQTPTACTVI